MSLGKSNYAARPVPTGCSAADARGPAMTGRAPESLAGLFIAEPGLAGRGRPRIRPRRTGPDRRVRRVAYFGMPDE